MSGVPVMTLILSKGPYPFMLTNHSVKAEVVQNMPSSVSSSVEKLENAQSAGFARM